MNTYLTTSITTSITPTMTHFAVNKTTNEFVTNESLQKLHLMCNELHTTQPDGWSHWKADDDIIYATSIKNMISIFGYDIRAKNVSVFGNLTLSME